MNIFLQLSTAANVLLVAVIPMIFVTAFNISLIRALKSHDLPRRSFAEVSGAPLRLQQERKASEPHLYIAIYSLHS
jgi:hypothetical protein